jgi:hypothetical protein
MILSVFCVQVDLKLGISAADFIKAYAPFVFDCTYDEPKGGGGGRGGGRGRVRREGDP